MPLTQTHVGASLGSWYFVLNTTNATTNTNERARIVIHVAWCFIGSSERRSRAMQRGRDKILNIP